jgi:RNA polymerase sigma-70 factor (ECF subfamily)
LVDGARRGDAASVERLLELHLPGLRAFIRLRMGLALRAREESQDIVQSVCRQTLQSLGTFRYEGEAAFKDWLYTTALNKLIDKTRHHRAQRRDVAREEPLERPAGEADESLSEIYGSLVTPSRDADAREQVRRFEEAFAELPEDYREVIVLARMVGLRHAEIAERLGRSEGAVRNLLYRGLARLSWLVDEPG